MKQPGKAVVWPATCDSTRTLKQGRRIRKELCIISPKVPEIAAAATNLGLKYEIVRDSSRPNSWWEKTGHLIIEKTEPRKTIILASLAAEIKRIRAGKTRAAPKV